MTVLLLPAPTSASAGAGATVGEVVEVPVNTRNRSVNPALTLHPVDTGELDATKVENWTKVFSDKRAISR